MPRQARQFSNSGYFHVMLRGNGKQTIFEDAQDNLCFLKLLRRYCGETAVTVCAYCLMENHAHLLLRDTEQSLPLLMKKLGVSYSHYYNKKYSHTGHLFQDRYKSEPVEDDAYLLTVFRYILRNSEKAGISPANEYKWSSYALYGDSSSFVDTSVLEELIGGRASYEEFIRAEADEGGIMGSPGEKKDAEAKNLLFQTLNLQSGTELQSFPKPKRDAAIRVLREKGLSIRQIERLTGISKSIVQRVSLQTDSAEVVSPTDL